MFPNPVSAIDTANLSGILPWTPGIKERRGREGGEKHLLGKNCSRLHFGLMTLTQLSSYFTWGFPSAGLLSPSGPFWGALHLFFRLSLPRLCHFAGIMKKKSMEYLESGGLSWTWVVTLFFCAWVFSWDMGIIIKCLSHMEFNEIILLKSLAVSMENGKFLSNGSNHWFCF